MTRNPEGQDQSPPENEFEATESPETADQQTGEEEEIVEEQDELAIALAERDDYLDQLQRSRAEFLNFKRRNDQERLLMRELISRDVLARFLPVIDDLDRAIGSLPESERNNSWVAGMELIQSKFLGILEQSGVKKLAPLGEPFDPKEHEAVATEPGTTGHIVVEIYQPGYKIGDTLIRPAMVKTGDAVPDASPEPSFNA